MKNRTKKRAKGGGQCYSSAGEAMMDAWMSASDRNYVLVHGRPTLTVEPFIEYGHAWLEFREVLHGSSIELDMCLDTETGTVVPQSIYYDAGNISPDSCHYYDMAELRAWVVKTGHWGPWEGPDACGPINSSNKEAKDVEQ